MAVIEDHQTTYPPENPIPIKSPIIEKRRTRDLPQINERIRFPQIRVIGTDGEQLGILTPQEAQAIADENGLDLVLVSDKADPPVCRIMDHGKYKFELEKKAREAKKKQHTAEVKEVKMRYTIEEHDYQVRVSQADRFIKSYVAHNGEAGAKEAGKWRSEGKDYTVIDGDIMLFRFNV